STNGSAGTPALQSIPANCLNPVPDPADPSKMTCTGAGPRVLLGNTLVPSTIFTPFQPASQRASVIDPTFVGGYGTALRNMFNNKYRTWSVGVQFNFPLRN